MERGQEARASVAMGRDRLGVVALAVAEQVAAVRAVEAAVAVAREAAAKALVAMAAASRAEVAAVTGWAAPRALGGERLQASRLQADCRRHLQPLPLQVQNHPWALAEVAATIEAMQAARISDAVEKVVRPRRSQQCLLRRLWRARGRISIYRGVAAPKRRAAARRSAAAVALAYSPPWTARPLRRRPGVARFCATNVWSI